MTSSTIQLPAVGSRWRLRHNVDRYPHFIAPEGAYGTVTDTYDSNISLKLDEPLAGAEDWDNEVVWAEDPKAENFARDCEAI